MTDPPTRPNASAWWELALYLLVGIGGFFLASVISSLFVQGVTLEVSALAYALNVLFFVGTVYALGIIRGRMSWAGLGLAPSRLDWKGFLGAFAVSLLLLPVRGLIGIAVQLLLGPGLSGLEGRMNVFAPSGFSILAFLVSLLGAGILVPIAEELFFRGALYGWFRRYFGVGLAVLVSSTMFALAHFDTIGVVASSFILGVVNAYLYERTRSLWAPITVHITTNTIAVLLIYLALALNPQAISPS